MSIKNRLDAHGLYPAGFEHDACGVGFIAHLKGNKSHKILRYGIEILENLEHRGAVGSEHNSGDGAGILIQMPHAFLKRECLTLGIELPDEGSYGSGIIFLPQNEKNRNKIIRIFEDCSKELGQEVLGWRKVPVDNSSLGSTVKSVEPYMAQVFIKRSNELTDPQAFERRLFVIRKYVRKTLLNKSVDGINDYFVCSLSYKTMLYKGMLMAPQVSRYFTDLADETMVSALAMVHSRFSTNTFPSWPLAQPFRFIAHNGEINTLRGNVNWMKAREAVFKSKLFTPDEIEKLLPIIDDTQSDSAIIDNAVELLTLSGRSLPHVMMMLIPEAWSKDHEMTPQKKAFYEFHATIMEPWDGPASIAFTDGHIIGATLDRNGLRPSRYQITDDDLLVMASEAGVIEFPGSKIIKKGWLQPGRMFVADLDKGKIIPDDEVKKAVYETQPYREWLKEGKITVAQLDKVKSPHQPNRATLLKRQVAFGNTMEDFEVLLTPMANSGKEPIGSMGSDTPLAVLSGKPQKLYNYFYQLFAQVTNPPIDPLREESIMSLVSFIGVQGDILAESEEHCRVIELPHPLITNNQLERLKKINKKHFSSVVIPTLFNAGENGSLEKAVDEVCAKAVSAVKAGNNIIILSDRSIDENSAPIPSLLSLAAVHHHLIREGCRTKCGIIVETGEALEVHHFALLFGYGASAVNPFLAFESIEDMRRRGRLNTELTAIAARKNFMVAIEKGLLKIMSKMGISTLQSYIGAQIFEAVGLSHNFVDKYFTGTVSKLGGIGIATIEEEALIRHSYAYPRNEKNAEVNIDQGGNYQWRARGEHHTLNPETIHLLQQATRRGDYTIFKEYSKAIHAQEDSLNTIRGTMEFAQSESIPIEEVEPVSEIVKRFFTGAMSFGSISPEAHKTLAIAMNRLGGRSNTGEGGEDAERFKPMPNGDSARSAIKQIASGRFGVTSNYLVNADELQIKMAQGAKPGEGGHLPGGKVDENIARIRHSTPGVGLISPPPHHDIYSIEDLAQLIYDLKNSNNKARINVKLVSEVGVGTIAAGVCKGHAEAVLISGHDGGTGASPQSSIKHAGLPWELGLAETHHVLMENNLRSRIVVQTDGRISTGRDVAFATLLGAEEWGSATPALVVSGCIMMRKCQSNTCPVGVATQDEELRKNYTGKPEFLVNYFNFMAEEMREIMAELGFRTVNEMVGRADKLKRKDSINHWKAKDFDVSRLLKVAVSSSCTSYQSESQDFGMDSVIDHELISKAKPALENKEKTTIEIKIRNVQRTVGTMLSAEVSRRYSEEGLPDDTIHVKAKGSAGQSFAAFGAKGITFEIDGEANDYFGKGLSGSKLIIHPPKDSPFDPHRNILIGNVAFYGATSGEAYIRGQGGERFCIRNSGAKVVVEGVGDNGCEYMTGGRVVILGAIGKNFAAGMSGGIAYLKDLKGLSKRRVNREMVDVEKLEDAKEMEEVKAMIQKHANYTGSRTAQSLIINWSKVVTGFIKIMPKEYKRALKELEEKEKALTV